MRLQHINLVANDAHALAGFYQSAFGCRLLRDPRHLTGPSIARGLGLAQVDLLSIWLGLPGGDGPFLELFEFSGSFSHSGDATAPHLMRPGYGHLCVAVADIHAACRAILAAGGSTQGQITDLGSEGAPMLCVYMRDPEGNIIELEQDCPKG